MDATSIAALRANLREEDGLFTEHVPIVEAFLCCQTQWRVASTMSRPIYLGLDYGACRFALEANGIEVTPELWTGLVIMELEATRTMNDGPT